MTLRRDARCVKRDEGSLSNGAEVPSVGHPHPFETGTPMLAFH